MLFAIWSVVAFAFEVPSGALADAWSRRGLYAVGELLTAAGYALWLIWPSFPGFALGFVLWGLGGALGSGALEALLYDGLDADGRAGDYARVSGRAGTVSILAMLAATLLATPAYAAGGYRLVGILSIATVTLGGLLALRLPDNRGTGSEPTDSYLTLLRTGLRESISSPGMIRAVSVAALLPGFSALDEYLPLLARDAEAATNAVPLWFALTALAMAIGSAAAGRWSVPLPVVLPVAAILVAAGALTGRMVPVSAAFGLLQYAIVRAETRLQDAITGSARSTVLSVSGFAAEVFAVVLYAWFALPVSLPLLFAACALPLLATALPGRAGSTLQHGDR